MQDLRIAGEQVSDDGLQDRRDGAASHGEPGRCCETDQPDDERPDDPAASGICGCCSRNQAGSIGWSMGGSWRAQAQPERAWESY